MHARNALQLAHGHARRGEFTRAAELYHRALVLLRAPSKKFEALMGLADISAWRGCQDQAERYLRQARRMGAPGKAPVKNTGAALNNRAARAYRRGDADVSERLYRRALRVKERSFSAQHPEVAVTLNNLGVLYKALGRLPEARAAYERALRIFEASLGRAAPQTCGCLKNLARLQQAEAKALLQRARRLEAQFEDMTPLSALAVRGEFRLEARRSPIHDVGIFAGEDIPAGVKVIEYTGKRVARRRLDGRITRNRTYCVKLDRYWAIDGAVGGSGAQYINHCCDPNLRPVREDGRIFFFSRRDISAGEELSIDYTYPKNVERVECFCGSAKCRGVINKQ